MKQIILKDLYHQRFVLSSGLVVLLSTLLIPSSVQMSYLIVPHIGVLLITVLIGIVLMEATEEKYYGYTFLSSLPISRLGIQGAKFGYLLSECILFSVTSLVILYMKGISSMIPMGVGTIIAISFSLNLVLGAIMLWGIYVFGLKNFTRGMTVVMILAQVFVFLFSVDSFAGKETVNQVLIALAKFLETPPVSVMVVALLAWSGLLYLTAQFRKRI